MMEFSVEWDFDEFASFLTYEAVHENVVSNVIANLVTRVLFIELSEEDLKELAPAVGDRIALKKVLGSVIKITRIP